MEKGYSEGGQGTRDAETEKGNTGELTKVALTK